MAPFKLAANLTFLFNDTAANYLDKYRLAAEMGFKYIESMFPPADVSLDQLVAAQTQYGLSQVLINTEVDDNFGYAAVKGKESLFRASLEKTIHYARTLNIPSIHIMSGKTGADPNKPEPISDAEVYATLKSNLLYACAQLEPLRLTALIEPINAYSLPSYHLNSVRLAERLIRELRAEGVGNLKLQLDFFHAQLIGGDLTHTLERVGDIVGHVQIAQAPERQEPQGVGEINYGYVFERLRATGYGGYVGLEYKPCGGTQEGVRDFLRVFDLKL